MALPTVVARWTLAVRYWAYLCILLSFYSVSLIVAAIVSAALDAVSIENPLLYWYGMEAPVFAFWLGIVLLATGATYSSLVHHTRVQSWLLIITALATIVAFGFIPRFIT